MLPRPPRPWLRSLDVSCGYDLSIVGKVLSLPIVPLTKYSVDDYDKDPRRHVLNKPMKSVASTLDDLYLRR